MTVNVCFPLLSRVLTCSVDLSNRADNSENAVRAAQLIQTAQLIA